MTLYPSNVKKNALKHCPADIHVKEHVTHVSKALCINLVRKNAKEHIFVGISVLRNVVSPVASARKNVITSVVKQNATENAENLATNVKTSAD